jgi:transcriptional regulator with XRE-family HTH domain
MALKQIFMANMKKYRKHSGFTQEKLAEMCNTDPCYIRQIEIGRRFPSLEYIERIANALNIAPFYLFFDDTKVENIMPIIMTEKQKQSLKSMLVDNLQQVCSLIDEKY